MTELNIGKTRAVACQKLVASQLCFGDCKFALKRGDGGTNGGPVVVGCCGADDSLKHRSCEG